MDSSGTGNNKDVAITTTSSNVAVKGLGEDPELVLALENYVPDTPEERRLVRKIDFVLLPLLWWMYVLAYLDRGNVVSRIISVHL